MPSIKKGEGLLKNWFFWLVIILVVLVGAYWWMGGFQKSYYAVYMQTGEIYFGQISYFPRMALVDPLVLQLTGDKNNPFSINRFKDSFWGPEGKVYLNSDLVVWKAKVGEGSKLMDVLKNPDLVTQNNQQQQQQQEAPTGEPVKVEEEK